ncbi:MAG: ABC transporter permease [Bacteroidaceae bacterium]|nr:ABC transporter permease [Bacteroidaceae bacterium]
MSLKQSISDIGRYTILMRRVFSVPDRMRMFFREYVHNLYALGVWSIPIACIVAFFLGAVVISQIQFNIIEPWMPGFTVGYAVREMVMLEFSSTVMCLILAGKIGSHIASELGTMRITQQIDAIDSLGINSANYLIFPKITAMVTMMPVLVIFSTVAGFVGAYIVCKLFNMVSFNELNYGVRYHFIPWHFWVSIIKSTVYAFIITSVPAYYGYTVKGGSQDVGYSSTKAVVNSSILILIADLVLTALMMS